MLALRLTRGARPAVQLRRLLVALASAGTGFLLLCTLGHAMSHPEDPSGSVLRLAWCLTPLAATVHLALAVARTDPGTRPRPGLAAIGLGPARLMAVSAATTALSCLLGSMLALLFFLHLRGDLTGLPFDGLEKGYEQTPDALAYAWFQRTKADRDIYASTLRAVHDDAVSDALDELLPGTRVVGVMGGHAMARGTEEYAGAARLGRELARAGLTVATGGGPGAMEAANLGAYAAPFEDSMLDEACELLAGAPSFAPSITDWARAAFEVRRRWPRGGRSVGIPTWFYGHEPPNAFASHIAKYFANATREDGLLACSNAGVVFLPGAAGTVQEIFDNATPNYYESRGEPTPMVLVDRAHWTERLPTWPLLQALARDRSMQARIALVDRIEEAPGALKRLTV
ncbi:LOG family protein [Streptomyces shaanxiensis]